MSTITSTTSLATATPARSESCRARGQGLGDFSSLAILLQLTDSSYPTGAFTHSAGLEGMCQLGQVTDPASLESFLAGHVFHGLEFADLPVLRLSFEAAVAGDGARMADLDEVAAALRNPEELRLASSRMGRQRLDLLGQVMRAGEWDPERWEAVTGGLRENQLPVVAGIEAAFLKLPCPAMEQAFAFSTLAGTLSAAMKLLRIGQSVVQGILHRQCLRLPAMIERSRTVTEDRLGTFTPLLDIASSRHKRAFSRLFLS